MIAILATIFFILFAFRCILFWTNLWQLKEYRLDRLFIHLRDTQQGRKIVFSYESLLLFIVFIFYIVGIFFDALATYYPFVVVGLFTLFTLRIIFEVLNKKIKRPIFTTKAVSVVGIAMLFVVCMTLLPLTDISFWLIIIALLIPFIVAFVVFLFAFPTEIYTDWYVQKAKIKRKNLKHLQVIAVSGSYGKSSTKEIIAHVLSQKYSVAKTAFSNNTPLAIAKTILQQVTNATDFFIVELGAYKRGEIRQLAEMVGPTISVTTAISDQHLALYGSMDDVIASELELIHQLPKKSMVLLNGTHKEMQRFAEKIKSHVIFWYTVTNKVQKNAISAYNIHSTTKGVAWKTSYGKYSMNVFSPLIGAHTVENILPAIFLGLHFGLTMQQVQQRVRSLHPLPKTMELKHVLPGITVVDDSFNASPESVLSATDYLLLFPKKKIFVFSPLIELGKMSKERHREIGEKLGDIDTVFLTNKNFMQEIQEGITKKHGKTKLITGSYKFLAKQLKKIVRKGDAVVFEGKEAGVVLRFL